MKIKKNINKLANSNMSKNYSKNIKALNSINTLKISEIKVPSQELIDKNKKILPISQNSSNPTIFKESKKKR